ncbi:MAG: hypothetical protein ACE1ZA_15005, partial [Pseudomonadales bacterium]
ASVSKTDAPNDIRQLASVPAHRRCETDCPNWRRSRHSYDTDAVSGFAKTPPVFSTDAGYDRLPARPKNVNSHHRFDHSTGGYLLLADPPD